MTLHHADVSPLQHVLFRFYTDQQKLKCKEKTKTFPKTLPIHRPITIATVEDLLPIKHPTAVLLLSSQHLSSIENRGPELTAELTEQISDNDCCDYLTL